MKFPELTNYRDKTYRAVLISCLLIMILTGDILNPALSYMALHLPAQDNNFINYATWSNIAPSLPFMLSVVISYSVNNLGYRRLIFVVFVLSLVGCGLLVNIPLSQFFVLSVIIALIGVLYRAVFFSLDRQLSVTLVDKIYDFQSDILLWGSILGAANIKLSSFLYSHYQLTGLVVCFVIGSCGLYYFLRQIPPVVVIEKQFQSHSTLVNPLKVLRTLREFPGFVIYILIMAVFMLIGSSSNLLLMTKIHQEQIAFDTYTTLLSGSMLISAASALFCKMKISRRWSHQAVLVLLLAINALFTIIMAQSLLVSIFAVSYVLLAAVNGIIFINMNSLLFEHLKQDHKLVSISPLINGFIASFFFAVSLLGQLASNVALKAGVDYRQIYLFCGIATFLLAGGLLRLKAPQAIAGLNEL